MGLLNRLLLVVAVGLVVATAAVAVGAESDRFDDDDGRVHELSINRLAAAGVLDGTECGDRLICPSRPLQRWEMAVWLGRVLATGEPSAIRTSRFADVDADEWWAPHVERFADLGVTAGCRTGPLRFCPDRAVTRAQMATFLVRALGLEGAPSAGFADTAGNAHAANIDALAAAGVTSGCKTDPFAFLPGSGGD